MLLEEHEDYRTIASYQVGMLQHDPYSWELLGKQFVPMEDVTADSRFLDVTIKTWFAEMTNQERNQLVDVMFTLLGTGGVDNALDIFHPKNAINYLKTLSNDENMRRILSSEFQSLIEAAKKTKAGLDQTALPKPE